MTDGVNRTKREASTMLPDRNTAAAVAHSRHRIALALQGGGSLGAFTWGVLDCLLEREIGIDAVSGASAGAVNAAVLASGLATGGRDGGRAALERFWRRASGGALSPALSGALALSTSVLSPYAFNPLDLNPLRTMLSHEVDIDRIRAAPPFRLLIGATRVADGSLRLFDERSVTIDAILASACLPLLNQAVTIDGEDYWDGGYAANPPLIPLIEASDATRIVVVQIIPTRGAGQARSRRDIARRLDNITFNASLTRDLDTVALARRLAGATAAPGRLAACTIERIAAEDAIPSLADADPLNLDWSFLVWLRDAGREAAAAWIDGAAPAAQRPSPEAQSASSPSRNVG